MKKLIIALALTTAFAAPSLAQSFNADYGTANIAPGYMANVTSGLESFAQAPVDATAGMNAVVVNGKIVGADPDTGIRLSLRRDAYKSAY